MEKKLYWSLTYDGERAGVMELSGALEYIRSSVEQDCDQEYIEIMLVPKWLTDEEFKNLPEL